MSSLIRTHIAMGTTITIEVVNPTTAADAAVDRALNWFHEIEDRCSRFVPDSELMQLTAFAGEPVTVSPVLFEAVRFALLVAEETDGAFDPAIGHHMERRGFNRHHRTRDTIHSAKPEDDVSFRDVEIDSERHTILLKRHLTLDLGAVAKGLAVDAAARELAPFRDYAIDAGGDLWLSGANNRGEPWAAGIRHPRRDGELIARLLLSDKAICTSGDYERRVPVAMGLDRDEHHILDPRTGSSPRALASATVIAPNAMLADALATAAFVLGPEEGIELLERMNVAGLLITPDLERFETGDLPYAA